VNRVRKIARRAAQLKPARKQAKDEQREKANENRRRNRPARIVTALAGVLIALIMTGCLAADGKPINAPPEGDAGASMAVYFGDSLCWDALDELQALYGADQDWRESQNCFGGTQLDTPLWWEKYGFVTNAPSQMGATVIVALGTNDIGNDASLDDTKAQARYAIETATNAGASTVVVPTVAYDTLPEPRRSKTLAWNQWLWQADASTNPAYRALRVVDWATYAAGHPDWYKLAEGDVLHNTPAGQQAYAEFLYAQRTAVPGA
jgi:predicted nucleic acid-binding Zn ribbon protein